MRADDAVLELLLPGAADDVLARTRRTAHFLRLLVDDASAAHAHTVSVDLLRARRELEAQGREQLEATLRELLRHHLEAALPSDAFLSIGEARVPVQSAWSTIEELRATWSDLPSVPSPGETPLAVAERLIAAFEGPAVASIESGLWRARWTRLAHGPRAGEEAHLACAAHAAGSGAPLSLRRAALAGVAECMLDRGGVREARAFLLEQLPRVGGSHRLRLLLAWARLLLDDAAGARSVLVGLKPWAGTLPRALVELRERKREWLPMLAGRVRPPAPSAMPEVDRPVRERGALGASVLGVFAFARGSGARALAIDVAPALRGRLERWLADNEGAASVPGTLPHRLLVEARAVCQHREDARSLAGALGEDETRAAFLEPVLDEDGEVAGWIHVELEHHLVPGSTRREAIARAWREKILLAAARPQPAPAPPDASRDPEPSQPIVAQAYVELVEELGIKTAQRLWSAFELGTEAPELVCAGGAGQGFPPRADGRRKALERATSAGGPVMFDEPDERLAVHAGASSGVVLLLRTCGRASGLLSLESSRRRDFKLADLERLQAAVDAASLAHRVAQFRHWHVLRFGHDVWFDAKRADFADFARRLVVAARTSAPLVLSGPAGVGKKVLARWAHFESASGDGALHVASCARLRSASAWREALAAARGATLLLEDLEQAVHEVQEELLHRIEGADVLLDGDAREHESGPRLLLTTRYLEPARCVADEDGRAGAVGLRADLARRLDRLRLHVPPLCERREDILPLVACLLERFATEEGLRVPALAEEALALLWRQPWEGNVRELENVVYKLALYSRTLGPALARELTPEHVLAIARQHGLDLVRRLPSRHPARSDLLAALRVSRTRSGRFNKTRAALFLGWDPDQEAGRGGLGRAA